MDAEHAAMLMALQADVTIEAIVAQAPLLAELLRDLERSDAIEKLSALLLLPEHQGNTPRLEFLVHAAFAICDGNRKLSRSRANQLFKACDDTIVSRLEDPAEDHFATPVYFQEEEFLVIEGLWESGNFYLQRILNALATAPNEGVLVQLKKQTHALLSLSNAACQERMDGRYVPGAPVPGKSLQPDAMLHPEVIRFSPSRLKELGIEKGDLAAFQFPVEKRKCLLSESLAVTSLHRQPIIEQEGDLIAAIPGAVSFAIRQSLFEVADHLGNLEQLSTAIGQEYERLFRSAAILGTHRHAPIHFVRSGSTLTAEVVTRIDRNTWLQVVFFADTLHGISESSVAGPTPPNLELAEFVRHQVLTQNRILENQPDFKEGISLLVDCGVGRSGSLLITNEQSDAWTIEPITAPDLLTLSRIDEMDSLRFMTMLKSRKVAEDHGVRIINPWGVATLIAWMRSNGGHIVPHRDVSQDLRGESFSVSLLPACIRDLRLLDAEENDTQFAIRSDGTKHQVRRLGGSTFIDDRKTVVYIPSQPDADGGLPYVHCTAECDWWFVSNSDSEDPNRFQHGETALTWMRRIIPVVAPEIASTIGKAIEVHLHFPGTGSLDTPSSEQALPTATEIRSEMQMTVNECIVTVQFGKSFDLGLRAPDNRSERALV